ncbi:MAG: SAM-dependent chlorinase/fluorinase [Ignavibacteriae bacterium]|nr:SAM-dependent chlorinase/fluorinase [Ignavibacteriota bacterium]
MKRKLTKSRRTARKVNREAPTIALLTDFGTTDHYVGTVKAVIRSINSTAAIIDITHEVSPQQIRQAGYLLWATYKFFPEGTVFLSVVDPGVGTKRRILAVRTSKFTFLAPDNMLLDFVLSQEQVIEAVEVSIESTPYVLSQRSNTFHGRDIFAPVAAYLASGVSLKEIGNPVKLHPVMSPFVGGQRERRAEVLHIDRFGNLITNIRIDNRTIALLTLNSKRIDQWTSNYAEAPEGTPCLIIGSSELVEIVVKNGSAEQFLQARVGNTIDIQWQ